LKYRTFYPQIMEVVEVDTTNQGVAKLVLRGTYVHPYDEKTMGSLERNRRQFGGLEISDQKWADIQQRLPLSAKERVLAIIEEDGLSEVWLLSIPGRALVMKQDGIWRVDIYHFEDKVMYQTPPRRIILEVAEPSPEDATAAVPVAEDL
ncbi:MAG: hypothetical protein K8I00_00920, partial [Candidatus Omnitrophica bacterium]|nr:hypothetical protein [Candidatus Omnitrophota bacterium]